MTTPEDCTPIPPATIGQAVADSYRSAVARFDEAAQIRGLVEEYGDRNGRSQEIEAEYVAAREALLGFASYL